MGVRSAPPARPVLVPQAPGRPPAPRRAQGSPPASSRAPVPVSGAPFERVLVATDFSVPAGRAVGRALRLPLSEGATITMLHVVPLGIPGKFENVVWADAKKVMAEQAEAAAETAKAVHGRTVRVVPEVVRGKPAVEILRRARDDASEILVLGRHGRRGIRELFLGSTAERVVRLGSVPSLVVLNVPTTPYRAPLAAVDGSDDALESVRGMLRVLARPVTLVDAIAAYELPLEAILSRAGVPLMEIAQSKAETRKVVWNLVQNVIAEHRASVRWNTILRVGDPRRVVIEEVARGTHDLVALGRRGRTRLPQLLLGGLAEAVLRAAPCDMLFGPLDRSDFELL